MRKNEALRPPAYIKEKLIVAPRLCAPPLLHNPLCTHIPSPGKKSIRHRDDFIKPEDRATRHQTLPPLLPEEESGATVVKNSRTSEGNAAEAHHD
ncbi:MAG: hypothetical protein LBH04_09925 [Tannerellaceae bacterium]|nr:hypothetical protein [Tannerellaceae bacterium]